MSGPDSSSTLRDDGLRGMTALGAMGWTFASIFGAALLPVTVTLKADPGLSSSPKKRRGRGPRWLPTARG